MIFKAIWSDLSFSIEIKTTNSILIILTQNTFKVTSIFSMKVQIFFKCWVPATFFYKRRTRQSTNLYWPAQFISKLIGINANQSEPSLTWAWHSSAPSCCRENQTCYKLEITEQVGNFVDKGQRLNTRKHYLELKALFSYMNVFW